MPRSLTEDPKLTGFVSSRQPNNKRTKRIEKLSLESFIINNIWNFQHYAIKTAFKQIDLLGFKFKMGSPPVGKFLNIDQVLIYNAIIVF